MTPPPPTYTINHAAVITLLLLSSIILTGRTNYLRKYYTRLTAQIQQDAARGKRIRNAEQIYLYAEQSQTLYTRLTYTFTTTTILLTITAIYTATHTT